MELFITKPAELEIRDAWLHYDAIDVSLGNRFQTAVMDVYEQILHHPRLFQKRYGRTRVCFLSHFPYGVQYLIFKGSIYVTGFFHQAQNPKVWDERSQDFLDDTERYE